MGVVGSTSHVLLLVDITIICVGRRMLTLHAATHNVLAANIAIEWLPYSKKTAIKSEIQRSVRSFLHILHAHIKIVVRNASKHYIIFLPRWEPH